MTKQNIIDKIHEFLRTHHENVECDNCLNVFEDLKNLVSEICEEEKVIDWEQRRYEIAKEVLASSFSTLMEGASILWYVRSCVQVADFLIKELKGGRK